MTPEELTAALASDALDELGLGRHVLGARQRQVAGRPFTGRALPATVVVDEGRLGEADGLLDVVEAIRAGDAVVLACAQACTSACWGELLTRAAIASGAVGLVTSGHVRDTAVLRALGWPVIAAGSLPARPDGRVNIVDIGRPASIDGVAVAPGDLVVADEDGVVIVPSEHVDAVLERAGRRRALEGAVRERVSAGVSLRAAKA